jgi:hypothetical protein
MYNPFGGIMNDYKDVVGRGRLVKVKRVMDAYLGLPKPLYWENLL